MPRYKIISISLFLLLYACAVQSYPSGGPLDIDGPNMIKIEPKKNVSNIKHNSSIKIVFDEMIDPGTVKSSIHIYPKTEIIIKCHSNKIEIKPKDSWPNGIFRIVCSRFIKDFNNNLSDSCKVLTYSTSEIIPQNLIHGNIYNYDSTAVNYVGLFEYNAVLDTFFLNYATESNIIGEYIFPNIKNGEYLLVASTSKIKNIYEEVRANNYSLSSNIVKIFNNNSDNNNLYFYHPAERLKIKSFNMINNYFGKIELTNGQKINLISNNTKFDNLFNKSDNFLRLDIKEVYDSINVELLLSNHVEEYTIKDKLKLNFPKEDKNNPEILEFKLVDTSLELIFSEPILIDSDFKDIFYTDSTLHNENIFNFRYINPMKLEILDVINYAGNIKIKNLNIKDLSNNSLLDSSLSITINNNLDNVIKGGDIFGEVKYNGANDVIVEVKNLNNSYKIKLIDNQFHFINVSSGVYKIWAYENINILSDNYFNGILEPLQYSAKFDIYDKNIEIRSNWDIEGIILNLN